MSYSIIVVFSDHLTPFIISCYLNPLFPYPLIDSRSYSFTLLLSYSRSLFLAYSITILLSYSLTLSLSYYLTILLGYSLTLLIFVVFNSDLFNSDLLTFLLCCPLRPLLSYSIIP